MGSEMCIRDRGKHTGKVIVSFPDPFVSRRGEPLVPAFAVKAEGTCLLYTSDAADERSSVDLGGRRIITNKNKRHVTGSGDS